MKIQFFGAAGEVTGSNYLVTVGKTKFLVDCGLFQGEGDADERNASPFEFDPKEIDFVLLTHAHIDHSGRLPKLVKEGFRGKIYSTLATKDLCEIMLLDSAKIQENDVEWQNRKRLRAGKDLLQPLYSVTDAQNTLSYFETAHYYDRVKISDNVTFRFQDAGHILGSAIIEVWLREDGQETKVLFSGDLGMPNRPILRDPDMNLEADYLVMESTYGASIHDSYESSTHQLMEIIDQVAKKGGTVVIPTFAVGRMQEMIYQLNYVYEHEDKEGKHIRVPIYVDSPMAVEATKAFQKHSANYDDNAKGLIRSGDNPFSFDTLKYIESVEESRYLNTNREARVILSSSGMATAGRVRHHLKHNLWDENSAVVFIGYQANGTLGRILKDGAEKVKLFGEEIVVKAKIFDLGGFSAHADEPMLLSWVESMSKKPKKIFLVHGEIDQQVPLKQVLESAMEIPTEIIHQGQSVLLESEGIVSKPSEVTEEDISDMKALYQRVETLSKEFIDKKDKFMQDEMMTKEYDRINRKLIEMQRALMDLNMIIGK